MGSFAVVVDWVSQTVATAPQHVVDLGAGTGQGSLALARRFPTARITAVDEPVDLVWASAVLHEVDDPRCVLAAVLSALRPGGPTLGDRLSASDLAVLETLLTAHGPHALTNRADLTVRATRTAWLARRP